MAPPVSNEELERIASEACTSTLSTADTYVHSSVEGWNASIINHILQNIVSSAPSSPQYKYAVNSTIIQHLSDHSGNVERSGAKQGRRGLHSAIGAYWNNDTDGMWSYKHEGDDRKGMDVVISVIWVAV